MKLLRRIEPGIHPGVEFGQLLTEKVDFTHAAPFAGFLEYESSEGEKTVLGLLHGFVPNEGTAWQDMRRRLQQFFERLEGTKASGPELRKTVPSNIYDLDFALAPPAPIAVDLLGADIPLAETIGVRAAQLHLVLAAQVDDPAFAPEPFNDFYRQSLYHGYLQIVSRRLEFLRQRYSEMREDLRLLAAQVLERENDIIEVLAAVFKERIYSERTRFHGRLHLGHLLVTGNDVVIYDFEGDPHQSVSERRLKRTPIRDVTSMLMSFGYAAQTVVRQLIASEPADETREREIREAGRFWYTHMSAAFLRGYWKIAEKAAYMPRTRHDQQVLLNTYLMERALLDTRADIQDKPELAGMPLRVILHLLKAEPDRPAPAPGSEAGGSPPSSS
jgi:maltose alpha-D-glucosyltransferase/alpha-amylase